MDINKALTQEFSIKTWQVEAVVKLVDEGNTIPFIARYRKEAHGSLTDETLRDLHERLTYLRNLEQKKEQVISTIDEQGLLTDDLRNKVLLAKTLVEVEDIYRPYRPKRKTRATIAKAKGLEPLAMMIMMQNNKKTIIQEAEAFIDVDKEVPSAEEALAGARDIIAELIADDADYRKYIRQQTFAKGVITSKAKKPKEKSVFEMYYDYDEDIRKIVGHRILAINRGEKEKILTIKIVVPEEQLVGYLVKRTVRVPDTDTGRQLILAVEDCYKRLIAPSIEREIRNDLTERLKKVQLVFLVRT